MLSINIGFNKVNFICLDSTNEGPFISFADSYPLSKIDDLNNFVSDILLKDKVLLDSIDNNLALSVDTDYLTFNQKFISDESHLGYSDQLSNSLILKEHYDSYYYPIGNMESQYLGVHIKKEIKDQIIKSFSSIGKINKIGINLFSAEIGASKLFGSSEESRYMVIRFNINNHVEVLFVDDGLLSSFSKFRFNTKKNKLENKFFFGDREYYLDIENSLFDLFKGSSPQSNFNCKLFVYQTSGKSKIIDSFLKNNNENIIVMNIFDIVRNNDIPNTAITGMPYIECAQIFRGVDA